MQPPCAAVELVSVPQAVQGKADALPAILAAFAFFGFVDDGFGYHAVV
jgi:hypothetical protein